MSERNDTARFAALDGLRGVFAVAVVLFHAGFASHIFALPPVRAAYLSVDFFFVLSGFVIAHAYAGRLTDLAAGRAFVSRRIGRVWPLHAVMLGLLVVIELAKLAVVLKLGITEPSGMPFSGPTSPYALVTNLLLVQSLDLHDTTTWNYPAWSISAELVAYLLFAGICLFARRWALWIAAGIVAAATAIIAGFSTSGMDLTFHLGAVRGCLGFFLGWLVYAAWRRWPLRSGTAVELALLAVIGTYLCVVGRSDLGYGAPFLFAIAIYLLAGARGLLTQALQSPVLQFLGRISYSIYMVHAVVLIAVGLAANLAERLLHMTLLVPADALFGPQSGSGKLLDVGGPWAMDAATLATLAVVVGISSLTYRWIEMPGQRLVARLATRAAAPLPAPLPAASLGPSGR
jgi:peptidoglycan/LPS O-acetylase OafA/YrhL